ncbi:hypothetical protein B484DRAFT_266294 [Ochromonadaceae sp. CCMP2298]|nr:hypothetical protein B484DRAFT_266294 [Ochromonadaceae sp. CCMP2298]
MSYDFLLCLKNKKRYFQRNRTEKGGISYPASPSARKVLLHGLELNGSGKLALSGGQFDSSKRDWSSDEDVKSEALREFLLDCGPALEGVPSTTTLMRFGEYAGCYVHVSPEGLQNVFHRVGSVLKAGEAARLDIMCGAVKREDEISSNYPMAPLDNNMQEVFIWNTAQHQADIEALGRDPATDWHFQLIASIRKNSDIVAAAAAAGVDAAGQKQG